MTESLISIIQASAKPTSPIKTNINPQLKSLQGIEAVIWDVYGTMFISASGDIESTHDVPHSVAMQNVLSSLNIQTTVSADECVSALHDMIRVHHSKLRESGIAYPEVDICSVWKDWTAELLPNVSMDASTIKELIVQYEVQINPVWQMPNLVKTLESLRKANKKLGIISNAQFYTRLIPSAFFEASFAGLGFDESLCVYSYEHKHGKPDLYLYKEQVNQLAKQQISPSSVLYIGNDMLKDIWPASQVGFHTALFAGDKRSLKLREDDSRIDSLEPTLVLTDLLQITECV